MADAELAQAAKLLLQRGNELFTVLTVPPAIQTETKVEDGVAAVTLYPEGLEADNGTTEVEVKDDLSDDFFELV